MNKSLLTPLLTLYLAVNSLSAMAAIIQCEQPDGTIEFTNKGCSKENQMISKRSFSRNFTQSHISKINRKGLNSKGRKQALFTRSDFIHLQNKMIQAQNPNDLKKHAKTIIEKILKSAKQGKIKSAYNMVAATYAKVSKKLKKRQWEGQLVEEHTLKVRSLFEEILISQSTTSTSAELNQVIQTAWKNFQSK